MAEDKKQIPLVELFRLSGMITNSVTLTARPPRSTPALVRDYCPQVSVECDFCTDPTTGKTFVDKMVRLELYPHERVPSEQFPHELDSIFRQFAVEGKFKLGSGQLVQCIRPDGYDIWPDLFTLKPLFEAKHLVSEEAVEKRLKTVADYRKSGNRKLVYVPLWAIQSALADGESGLCADSTFFCQRCATEDGRLDLWIGSLPPLPFGHKPNKKGKLKVEPEDNGSVVCLTADFLERFLPVMENVLLPEMKLFYEQLYDKNG